MIHTN